MSEPSGEDEETTSSIALVLEYVDPSLIYVDLDAGTYPQLLRACASCLVACGVDTNKTRLVITGDFVQSVRDRGEAGSTYHENYDTQRNTGMVGGKTIPLPDGTVDVLLQAVMFLPEHQETDWLAETTLHTLVHEAQHVLTAQNGEQDGDFQSEPWARLNFLTAADQVIEEYRAECVASEIVGSSGWNGDDLVASINAWLTALRRIATVEYQSHLDVDRFSYDILQQTHTFWKLLAYVVAEQSASGQELPAAVAEDDLWALMVEPFWEDFKAILATVPTAEQRTPRNELDAFASRLADLLQRWLSGLGFDFVDRPGGAAFHVTDWTLLTIDLD